jgi:hypothetical protein
MSAEAIAAVLEAIEAPDEAAEREALPKRFCFVEGTHIATLRGEMPVQHLRVGDHIRAKKGSFHVVSEVAVHLFDELDREAQAKIALGRILRGAVDEGIPKRDLYVSEGQQFELSRRLEIAHAVRMTVRKSGDALSGMSFVVFACDGLPMIRAEGIWTTLTPMERVFPAHAPQKQPEDAEPVPEAAGAGKTSDAPAAPQTVAGAAPAQRPTRRRLTRILSKPVSMPASHRTETGTPGP